MAEIHHYDKEWLKRSSDGLLVVVERVCHGSHVLHDHEFHELVLIEQGSGHHLMENGVWPIESGSVFLIPSGVRHGYKVKKDIVLRNILFTETALHIADLRIDMISGVRALLNVEPDLRLQGVDDLRLKLTIDQLRHAISLIDGMKGEIDTGQSGYKAVVSSFLIQLIIFLARRLEEPSQNAGKKLVEIAALLNYIEEGTEGSFSLKSVASSMNLSMRTLQRKFREATGTTPLQYHTQCRISRARELIEVSDANITEIGMVCGFYDASHFSRTFRKIVGVSPREYRMQIRESVQSGGGHEKNAL